MGFGCRTFHFQSDADPLISNLSAHFRSFAINSKISLDFRVLITAYIGGGLSSANAPIMPFAERRSLNFRPFMRIAPINFVFRRKV